MRMLSHQENARPSSRGLLARVRNEGSNYNLRDLRHRMGRTLRFGHSKTMGRRGIRGLIRFVVDSSSTYAARTRRQPPRPASEMGRCNCRQRGDVTVAQHAFDESEDAPPLAPGFFRVFAGYRRRLKSLRSIWVQGHRRWAVRRLVRRVPSEASNSVRPNFRPLLRHRLHKILRIRAPGAPRRGQHRRHAFDEGTVRVLDGAAVLAEHPRSWGRRQIFEKTEHRAALVTERKAARDLKGRDRIRAVVPFFDHIVARWEVSGSSLGLRVTRAIKLLDLYGEDVFLAAATDIHARGISDVGALAVACEHQRKDRHRPVPIELVLPAHLDDADVIPHDLAAYDE